MVDYSSMSDAELVALPMHSKAPDPNMRAAVRKLYPECRGVFAANATRRDLQDVLTKAMTPAVSVALYKANLQPKIPPEPVEGVGGENPPQETESFSQDALDAEMDTVVDALRTLRPRVADKIAEIIAASRNQVSCAESRDECEDLGTRLEAVGGKVTIGKVQVPLITKDPGPEVPPIDPDFRFDVWNAARKVADLVEFGQEASDLIKLLLADERIMLCGPPSVGKTSVITQFAARAHWPVTRFNGNQDVTVQDFVGCWEARDGSTSWVDGPLVHAMKDGHILIVDEMDHMPSECSSILHSVLEQAGRLAITSNGGEVVGAHANFRVVATMNTGGFGDETGMHPNAQVQDAAFLDRFGAVFHVTWIKPSHEKALLVKKFGVSEMIADLIVKVAKDTRRSVEQHKMLYPLTHRNTFGWAGLSRIVGVQAAFALAVLNKVPQSDVPVIAEIAQRHFGEDLGKMVEGGE